MTMEAQNNPRSLPVIEKPSVHVISKPAFDVDATGVADRWAMTEGTDADHLVEFAGRVCYQAFGVAQHTKTTQKYIENLQSQQHWSVLEHANFSLHIAGVSRSLTHELIRHRHFSYSQQSQRYVDESSCTFVKPIDLAIGTRAYDLWTEAMWWALENYKILADELASAAPATLPARDKRIWARQQARSILPNATATELVMTGNVRAWRHFILLRGTRFAEPEIRRLAGAVCRVLCDAAPVMFNDITICDDGTIYGVGESS